MGTSVLLAMAVVTAAPVMAQTTGVMDTFNRPNAGSLGTADSGQTWTAHYGSFGIDNNAVAPPSGFGLASVDAGSSVVDVAMTVVQPANELWLVMRFQDDTNYWRFGRWQGQPYTLQQVQNNALGTPVLEPGPSIGAAAGDRLFCQVRITFIECSVNGVTIARTTDSFLAPATRAGLSAYVSQNARLDDFSAITPSAPDISVSLTAPATLDFGAEGLWRTTIRNVGANSATSVELVVTPDGSVSNVTVQGASCTVVAGTQHCSLGTLTAGQQRVVDVRATAPHAVMELAFSSSVELVTGETNESNNEAFSTTVTREPPLSGTRLFDSFDRADGPAGSADTGQSWTTHQGSLAVVSGTAQTGGGFVLASIDAGDNVGTLTTTVVTPSSELWVLLRFSDAANYWRFGRWQGQAYQLQRVMANGATVWPILASATPAAGDAVRCTSSEDQIECGVNDVTIAHASDAFNQAATRVGFSTYQSPGTRFDELLVTDPQLIFDASVSITGPASITGGTLGMWTISFHNGGDTVISSAEVMVTPPGTLLETSLPGCSAEGSQYRCSVGTVAPGSTTSFTLTGRAPSASGSLSLSASTPIMAGDRSSSNNSAMFSITVQTAAPNTAIVIDSFDRGNSSTLGVADTGQSWTAHAGTPGTVADEASLGSGFALASLNATVANADVSVTLKGLSAEFWLILRLSDGQNYWRFGRQSGGAYELQQVVGSNLGAPALQLLGTVEPTIGDRIMCRTTSDLIECAVGDVAVVRTSDSFNRTATRFGLSGFQTATARFDDLVLVKPVGPDFNVQVDAPAIALVNQHQAINIRVENRGNVAASSATLTVSMSSAFQIVQSPGGCTNSQQQFSCVPGNALTPGGFEDFAFVVSSSTVGVETSIAEVSYSNDAFPADNVAQWTTEVETADSGIFDDFNRADTQTGLGTTLTGQVWQNMNGGFRIAGGEALAMSAGSMVTIETGSSFGTLNVTIGSNAALAAIAFRVVDANNYYRVAADASGMYKVTKVVNGVTQDLQFYILRYATPVQSGDLVHIVTRPDDGVFVVVNGRHIIDAGDPQFMFATRWGLRSTGGTPSFRSFSWRAVIEGLPTHDAFNGSNGSLLTAPTSGVNYHWMPQTGALWIYDNGTARPQTNGYSVITVDTSSELATTSATLVQPGSAGFIVFRHTEIPGTYFRYGHEGGASYSVQYMSGSSIQPMPVAVQTLATINPSPGDVLEVRQSADGTVECVVNGVITHRFVDTSTGFRSTLTGLAGGDTSLRFDNFTVTPLP